MQESKPTDADKSKAYSKAQKSLREAHREEFDSYLQAEYEAIGFKWSPRKTDEQKALETAQKLLDQYPSLRGVLAAAFPHPGTDPQEAPQGAQRGTQPRTPTIEGKPVDIASMGWDGEPGREQ